MLSWNDIIMQDDSRHSKRQRIRLEEFVGMTSSGIQLSVTADANQIPLSSATEICEQNIAMVSGVNDHRKGIFQPQISLLP